jgi:hypothetical protein
MSWITLLTTLFLMAALALGAQSPVDGKWTLDVKDQGGTTIRMLKLEIAVKEGKAAGKLASSEIAGTFEDGVLELEFAFLDEESGGSNTLKLSGKLEGDKLVGDWKWGSSGGTFEAKRMQ